MSAQPEDVPMLYLQRYGNRAVKAQFEIEADSVADARRQAEELIEEERQRGALFDDVRLIGQPKPKMEVRS